MAALRGGVSSDRTRSTSGTRLADRVISTWANTWTERAEVTLRKDGSGFFELKDERTGEVIKTDSWGPNGGRGA